MADKKTRTQLDDPVRRLFNKTPPEGAAAGSGVWNNWMYDLMTEAIESAHRIEREVCTSDHAVKIKEQTETIRKLEDKLSDWNDNYVATVDGDCAPDERHCNCVPFLRKRIKRLEAAFPARSEGGEGA